MVPDYDFLETAEQVTLTFYIPPSMKNVPSFKLKDSSILYCDDIPLHLYRPVSHPRITHTQYFVELVFEKKMPGRWYSLFGPTAEVRKNLDALEKATDAELRSDPGDLFNILCNIYSNGSDDVRRAMNKSLAESKGTVLSTNWSDVSQKEVKPEN
ncbi:suppressor of G2 allele of SKP1 [Pancytospora epiphaga]|nr:suppressor of G2 allele of SKP1 [Pancytospora epiphaga]